jgi:hypothetical protein
VLLSAAASISSRSSVVALRLKSDCATPTGARGELATLPPVLPASGLRRNLDSLPDSADSFRPLLPAAASSAVEASDTLAVLLGDSGMTGDGGKLESENLLLRAGDPRTP